MSGYVGRDRPCGYHTYAGYSVRATPHSVEPCFVFAVFAHPTVNTLEQTEDFIGVLHVYANAAVCDLEDPFDTVVCRRDVNFRFPIAAIFDRVRD